MQTIRLRPQRPRIHCSIDVLFHTGALWFTRAIGIHRAQGGRIG